MYMLFSKRPLGAYSGRLHQVPKLSILRQNQSRLSYTEECIKLRLHTAINRTDFVSW